MPKEREARPQPTCSNHQSCSLLSQLHAVNCYLSRFHFVQHEAEVLDPTPLPSCQEPIMSPEEAP